MGCHNLSGRRTQISSFNQIIRAFTVQLNQFYFAFFLLNTEKNILGSSLRVAEIFFDCGHYIDYHLASIFIRKLKRN